MHTFEWCTLEVDRMTVQDAHRSIIVEEFVFHLNPRHVTELSLRGKHIFSAEAKKNCKYSFQTILLAKISSLRTHSSHHSQFSIPKSKIMRVQPDLSHRS